MAERADFSSLILLFLVGFLALGAKDRELCSPVLAITQAAVERTYLGSQPRGIPRPRGQCGRVQRF